MRFIKNFSKKLNPTQRLLVSLFVPIILLVIALPIAGEIGGGRLKYASNLDDNWWFWLLTIGLIGYFEFSIFSEKNNNI